LIRLDRLNGRNILQRKNLRLQKTVSNFSIKREGAEYGRSVLVSGKVAEGGELKQNPVGEVQKLR